MSEDSFATSAPSIIENLCYSRHFGSSHFYTATIGLDTGSGYLYLSRCDFFFYFMSDLDELCWLFSSSPADEIEVMR